MSKFHIGQMVKVVAHLGDCKNHAEVGTVGVVTEILDADEFEDLEHEELYALDSAPFVEDGVFTIGLSPDELEPILYDGAQPIAESFEEMMGKIREGVIA